MSRGSALRRRIRRSRQQGRNHLPRGARLSLWGSLHALSAREMFAAAADRRAELAAMDLPFRNSIEITEQGKQVWV